MFLEKVWTLQTVFESKVKEKHANTNTLEVIQIKGEKQLTDLAETINIFTGKFHEFEADRKLKEEIIRILRGPGISSSW